MQLTPGQTQVRLGKFVHYYLHVHRRRFPNEWAGMTRCLVNAANTIQHNRPHALLEGGLHLRKAVSIYDLWLKRTGQRAQMGFDDLSRLLLAQFSGARPGAVSP